MAKAPGPMLKALRMRAGVSSTKCGEVLGMSNANGYLRYENNVPYTEGRKIPGKIIRGVMPLLVGKGEPPVTRDELVAISELADLSDAMQRTQPTNGSGPSVVGGYVFAEQAHGYGLPVRYRVEPDVYMPPQKITERATGQCHCLPDPKFQADKQFAVVVAASDSFADYAPPGSVLVCVEPESAGDIPANKLVVVQQSMGNLVQVTLVPYSSRAPGTRVLGIPLKRIIPG